MVFQEVALFNELTVVDNIDYFCGLYIGDKNLRKQYVEDAIKLVGLEKFKNFYPKQLSGGLLRRLNIACGIAHRPKLIFFDEPTVAVDPQSRNNILSGIKKLRDDGATIIYTTHYMEEVELICNRVIILDKGKLLAQGSPLELKKLSSTKERITIELNDINYDLFNKIKEFKNIDKINMKDSFIIITYKKGNNNLKDIINFLNNENINYNKVFSERPTLNDVFLELTGKELRD